MKLTHKAIAIMCGYKVAVMHETSYNTSSMHWFWKDPRSLQEGTMKGTEQEAWAACCKDNGLVKEDV